MKPMRVFGFSVFFALFCIVPALWAQNVVPIADIQQNESQYLNQQVTIRGVVVLGAGITTTGWTDVYVQDSSNAGINIYRSGSVDNNLKRPYLVEITGTVTNYQGVTEITNYTVTILDQNAPLPAPVKVSTQQATDVNLEGTFVEVTGEITDSFRAGSGTNLTIDDGSGPVTVRVWDNTGVDLSEATVGKTVTVRGPLDIYRGNTQILLGYQEDLMIRQAQPGDGSGVVSVSPDTVDRGATDVTLTFTITGEDAYQLATVAITIPGEWQWSGDVADVSLSGDGFAGASVTVEGNQVIIENAAVTATNSGIASIRHLAAPDSDVTSVFTVSTAAPGGILTPVASSPQVVVGQGVVITPIRLIQLLTDQYLGQTVNIKAVVTLGAGITTTSWTDAYVQDTSGYGINVFQSGSVDNNLKRGNLVLITGTVEEFQGVTEITNYTLTVLQTNYPLPSPNRLTTGEANNTALEGMFVEVRGQLISKSTAGSGTNLILDDGSGSCTVRVWNTTGINVDPLAIGDTLIVRGPLDIYQGNTQIVPGYPEDIFDLSKGARGDGSGTATLNITSVPIDTPSIDLTVAIRSNPLDTLSTVVVYLPVGWQWSGNENDISLSGSGFQQATFEYQTEYDDRFVTIRNTAVTENDTGVVTIRGLQPPADSVISVVWVQTAGPHGTPQFIAQSPELQVGTNPRYQIYDLQTNPKQFTEAVTVEGVVTIGAGILRTDRLSAYIQDASGRGININAFQTPDTVTYRRGNRVRINGVVSEYRQTTQLDPLSATVLEENAPLPDPIRLSTGEANAPRWDGTLVQVHGVVTDKYSTSTPAYDYNVLVNDGSGDITVRIWGTTGIDVSFFKVNDALYVTGVGGVFVNSRNQVFYQILPGYQDQVVKDEQFQPSLANVSLEIPAQPFVPEMGERIPITFNVGSVNNQVTVRIFDLGGRLITTLLSEKARYTRQTIEWDGRDDLKERVPLGTYICHLEVIEPQSGKRTVKIAPIVIGTFLKR